MNNNQVEVDILIIGAGAAGLFAAIEAGKRDKKVIILEHANKPGKKILMSGGGRCNFTNYEISPQKYLSQNPHFCKSALARYTQWDFISLVDQYRIPYHEKEKGQLFCDHKSKDIVNMLLSECDKYNVSVQLKTTVTQVEHKDNSYIISTGAVTYKSTSLIVATGGLSIPTMGATDFGYTLAKQFNLSVLPQRAGLVPFVLNSRQQKRYAELSGVSLEVNVACNNMSFSGGLLFTHKGLSGPAILQISSYWQPGDKVIINLLPNKDLAEVLKELKHTDRNKTLKTVLGNLLPKKLVEHVLAKHPLDTKLADISHHAIQLIADDVNSWEIYPEATEGYKTAEVTLGGIDVNQISSKTMEVKTQPGLYFIGEVLDVTGWLGGYNFQWAWSSAWVAGNSAH